MKRVNHLPADDRSCGWFHLSRTRRPAAAHTGKTSARWVVVGAGLTGLAAARRIALHPLPHPSPLNAAWYGRFPGLLAARLRALDAG